HRRFRHGISHAASRPIEGYGAERHKAQGQDEVGECVGSIGICRCVLALGSAAILPHSVTTTTQNGRVATRASKFFTSIAWLNEGGKDSASDAPETSLRKGGFP